MSVPAHCELMKDAADKFSYTLEKVRFSDPKIPVIHNVDSLIEANPEKIKIKLIEQIYKPVRWLDTINSMLKMKVNTIGNKPKILACILSTGAGFNLN